VLVAKREPPASPLAAEALAHADALFNLACYLTANASEAEDLVQETYARALSAGDLFRGGSVKAWLFQILRNAHIDLYRKAKVHALATELEVWEGGAEDAAVCADISHKHVRNCGIPNIIELFAGA
jgi:DNA-directed RNA polymerase specialized sigma24 family protein